LESLESEEALLLDADTVLVVHVSLQELLRVFPPALELLIRYNFLVGHEHADCALEDDVELVSDILIFEYILVRLKHLQGDRLCDLQQVGILETALVGLSLGLG